MSNQYNQQNQNQQFQQQPAHSQPAHPHPVRDNFNPPAQQAPQGFGFTPEGAAQGSVAGGGGLETGTFVGVIVHCQHIISPKKQTPGISFKFEASSGTTIDSDVYWEPQIMAIMQCMGVTTAIAPVPGMVMEYDPNIGKRVQKNGFIYPVLCNKPIGMLFERVDYNNQVTGKSGFNMRLYAPFNAQSKQTVKEMQQNQPPAEIDAALERLLKKQASQAQAQPAAPAFQTQPVVNNGFAPPAPQQAAAASFDDDVPF